MARMDQVTLYQGKTGGAEIANVVQELFGAKYERQHPEFIKVWTDEYGAHGRHGARKGLHQRARLNPGLANDTNGPESFNNQFKDSPAGTAYTQPSVDGGDGFLAVLDKFLSTNSITDVEFGVHPQIELGDYRQAQLYMRNASMAMYSTSHTFKDRATGSEVKGGTGVSIAREPV